MATLADAFLEDFEEDEEEETVKQSGSTESDDEDAEVVDLDDVEDVDMEEVGSASVKSVSSLINDPRLHNHMARVEEFLKRNVTEIEGRVEDSEEYEVIIDSNKMVVDIDNDIVAIHLFMRDTYASKFPELEQMISTPVEFARVIQIIKNEMDMTVVKDQLGSVVPASTLLILTVTATTTSGKPLPAFDLKRVLEAADTVIELERCKRRIYEYVATRMKLIAPNLSALTGTDVAAKMIGLAGGLSALSLIPACNIQVLGAVKRTVAGMSITSADIHRGVLSQAPLLQNLPPDLKMRSIRVTAAKVALVARVDAYQTQYNESAGVQFHQEILAKIAKWQEPPPPKSVKPIVPRDHTKKRRRGGRKFQKQRERYKVTEVQKMKNRMAFGEAEETNEYTGEGFGLLGKANSGRLRIMPQDTQKLHKMNKLEIKRMKRQKRLAASGGGGLASGINSVLGESAGRRTVLKPGMQGGGFTSGTASVRKKKTSQSGTSSSVVLDGKSSMVFVDPEQAKRKVEEANKKYFGTGIFSVIEK